MSTKVILLAERLKDMALCMAKGEVCPIDSQFLVVEAARMLLEQEQEIVRLKRCASS